MVIKWRSSETNSWFTLSHVKRTDLINVFVSTRSRVTLKLRKSHALSICIRVSYRGWLLSSIMVYIYFRNHDLPWSLLQSIKSLLYRPITIALIFGLLYTVAITFQRGPFLYHMAYDNQFNHGNFGYIIRNPYFQFH